MRIRVSKSFMVVLMTTTMFFLLSYHVKAQTTWDGGAGTNNWTDANNWNPNGVPGNGDDILIDAGDSVVINTVIAATIDDITIQNGGILNIATGGSISTDNSGGNQGDFSITNGTLYITGGSMFIGDDLIMSGSSSAIIVESGSLEFDDQVNISNGANLTINGGTFTASNSGNDMFIDGATVTVNGGTLDAQEDLLVYNGGVLIIGSSGTVDVGDDLYNNDDGGNGGAGSQGTIVLNGNLNVADALIINNTTPDSGLNGSGTLDVGGTFADNEGGDFASCGAFPCTPVISVDILNEPVAVNSTTPFSITIEFSSSVTGFIESELVVTNGSTSNFSGSGTTYTADIIPTGVGDISIDIAANVTNESNAALSTVTVLFDTVAPNAIVSGEPASASFAFSITVTFDENMNSSTFISSDLSVTNGTASNIVETVASTTYTVDITPNGNGDITVLLPAGVANDLAGNANTISNSVVVTYVDALGPGDVMFLGFGSISETSPNGDGIAFVTLVDLPANQVLYFTDEEWDNTANAGAGGME